MAVVQISRIQVRRGQKNITGTVPTLSSGEFAWAVDTQELFIGNGSIAEGAPYVGNTKILTIHDNILELANSYKFAEDDITVVNSIFRSLQSKLEETVSVIDFGAIPDGSTDCTQFFENAFDELFKNPDDKKKKILFVPNGVYLFLSNLKIPSNVILMGENPRETVLDIKDNDIIFVSELGTEPGDFSNSDVPINIKISNLTIDHDIGQTEITASRNCEFENVIWRSGYALGDPVIFPENANGVYIIPQVSIGGNITVSGPGVSSTIVENFSQSFTSTLDNLVSSLNDDATFNPGGDFVGFTAERIGTSLKIKAKSSTVLSSVINSSFTISVLPSNAPGETPVTISVITEDLILSEFADGFTNLPASVYWNNKLFGISTNKIKFKECLFVNTPMALKCLQEDVFDSEIIVDNCRFSTCEVGIFVDGVTAQGNDWLIKDCFFENIASQAVYMKSGRGTKISDSVFRNCGNGNQISQYPTSSIIKFGESFGNIVIGCSSDRHQSSSIVSLNSVPGVIEFENVAIASLIDRNYSTIFVSDSFRPLSVFSASSRFIIIDYSLELGYEILSRYSRVGRITITIGDDLEGTEEISPGVFGPESGNVSDVSISETYTYSPNTPLSPGGKLMTDFEFAVELRDNDEDSSVETILLKYKNPLSNGASGSISYTITTGV